MIDKLISISRRIKREFEQLALNKGRHVSGYERFIDLRETECQLPVGIYCRGRHTGIHKLEVYDVAKLGLSATERILRGIVPSLDHARIYRIDACVDLLGLSPWDLGLTCHVPNVQNFRLYRSRGAVSFYLQSSQQRTLLIYDRGRHLQSEHDPLATLFRPDDSLTRIEVQLKGRGVPFKRFSSISRYAEYDWLGDVKFWRLKLDSAGFTPTQWLVACGLYYLIGKPGLQAVSKRFSPPEWAFIQKRYFEPVAARKLPHLKWCFRKSVMKWLNDQVYFPRAPEETRRGV